MEAGARSDWRAALIVGLLVAGLYLPMLAAPFDFRDDGDLVYPAGAMSLGDRAALTWMRIVDNWRHLGPFRPALWAHWDVQAELLGADPLRWRVSRLLWTALAAGALFWLLRELRIAPLTATLVTALVMWTPAPGEIWRSLTLSEGVAMPYAVGALASAVRAGRSRRALPWELAALGGTVVALSCKNTFVAIVPALVLLRVAPDGEPLAPAWRARGARASLLALPALLPAAHLLAFWQYWHRGQYEPGWPSWTAALAFSAAVITNSGAWAIGAGLLAAVWALPAAEPDARPLTTAWRRRRAVARAGVALLASGMIVYLPLRAVTGRYTIPAIWGAALLFAVLLDATLQRPLRRRAALALLLVAAGLAVLAAENLLRQETAIVRDTVLWHALGRVERDAPPGATVAWQGPDVGEGIHFFWHLRGRGRGDLRPLLLDPYGAPVSRPELPPSDGAPTWLVTPSLSPPSDRTWQPVLAIRESYRRGRRSVECAVWTRTALP